MLRRDEKIRATMYSSQLKIKCGILKTMNRANPITKTVVLARSYNSLYYYDCVALLIHEIGHVAVGGTDFRYDPEKAFCLAKKRPSFARVNLDNLSYFAVETVGINVPLPKQFTC